MDNAEMRVHYRVYVADMGKFRTPDEYEFIAEFSSEEQAGNYMKYMRGKQRYAKKDIIIREVAAQEVSPHEGKSVVACSVIGEYLLPDEWNF